MTLQGDGAVAAMRVGDDAVEMSQGEPDVIFLQCMPMAQPRSRNNKRVDEEATKEEDQGVRLCAALRGLLGGSNYVKQSLAAKCC